MAVADGQTEARSINWLATELGVARRTLGRILQAVTPALEERGSPRYWTRDVVAALRIEWAPRKPKAQKVSDLDEARGRRAAADAELAELELAKARGEMVPVADFEAALASALGLVRQHLLGMPDRGAQETYAAGERLSEHRDAWRRIGREILEDLSRVEVDIVGPNSARAGGRKRKSTGGGARAARGAAPSVPGDPPAA